MQYASPVAGENYQVISQRPETWASHDGGGVVEGMRVTFRDLESGVSDFVQVPNSVYGPDQVNALILARLQRIRGVHSLGQ
jgi:hypothetical protein